MPDNLQMMKNAKNFKEKQPDSLNFDQEESSHEVEVESFRKVKPMNCIKVVPLHSSDDQSLEQNNVQKVSSLPHENPLKKLAQITPQISNAFLEMTEQNKDISSTDLSFIHSKDY